MLTALASGLLLGLSCGLAPGPLLTLVLSHTLQHGWREGCKIALAPLVTDAPIILVALALSSHAADLQYLLGALSVAGGLFVLCLAVDTFRPKELADPEALGQPKSWLKGMLTNLLSPHPWLFWMTVGAATLAKAFTVNGLAATAFIAAFYLMLIGSKVMLALAAARSRRFLSGWTYQLVMKLLGLLLAIFAILLLVDGFQRFRG